MNTFETKPMPAYYGLTLIDNVIGIELHKDALHFLKDIAWDKTPVVKECMKKYALSSFTAPIDGMCGFNNVLTPSKSPRPHWIKWEFTLPKFKTLSGTGEASAADIMAIRATLHVFLALGMYFFEGITDSDFPQLMRITGLELPQEGRQYMAGNLCVSISPAVISWLTKQTRSSFDLLEHMMKSAYNYMWEKTSPCDRFSVVFTAPTRIRFDFPDNMNACGLMPSNSFSTDPCAGYTFVGNNMDSGLEQFTGLALLAAWHTLMRSPECT